MNRKRSKFVHTLAISLVAIGMLAMTWPRVAQATPPRPVDEMRDPIELAERAAPENVMTAKRAASLPGLAPDGTQPFDWSKVTFLSYRDDNAEIYAADGDGGNATRRTLNTSIDTTPDLDRGSRRVVFISDRAGNAEVYSMNFDGSGVTRLTFTAANEYLPTWSPDGQRVAFYSYRDGNAEIYVMNADGTNQTRLTFNAAWDGHPAWSPDSQQIAFASQRTGNYELFKMSAAGGSATQLTSGAAYAAYPDWSPDGSTILFNYDAAPVNGFYDVARISASGGAHTQVSWAPINADDLGPKWDPTGKYYAYTQVFWTLYNNQWYWTEARIPVRDIATSYNFWMMANSGFDWYLDWETSDIVAPASQVASLLAWLNTTLFTVNWSGTDPAPTSEIASYDIQVRDGNGSWTDWLPQTSQTSANFTALVGHTYSFRVRARDYAGNLEAYPSSADAMTTIYQHAANGQMLDNREQPVAVVNVQANPAALNTGVSRHDGAYDLYFTSGGAYTLTATRSHFGQLPPLLNVTVPSSNSLPTLYLPPLDNQLGDSHFESGDLSAWNPSGNLTPTIASAAHTGNYAAILGGSVPTDMLTTGPWHSAIEQTINVSPTIVSGTLSLLYRVGSAEPLSDTLTAYIVGASNRLTLTLPMTATEWTHAWFDLSAWNDLTATVKIDFTVADTDRVAEVKLDEITWGSAIIGSHTAFLPLVRR